MTPEDYGRRAWERGALRVPHYDREFNASVPAGTPAKTWIKLLDGWLAGWDRANLEAPVPGMEEQDA